jgi:F420-0:gamma-glutamyl ligase-like protein
MAKNKPQRRPEGLGLALVCICYGGILGYVVGQSHAEKQAARRADKMDTMRRLRQMEDQLHKLTNPEAYDEQGRLKPISTMGFNVGGIL